MLECWADTTFLCARRTRALCAPSSLSPPLLELPSRQRRSARLTLAFSPPAGQARVVHDGQAQRDRHHLPQVQPGRDGPHEQEVARQGRLHLAHRVRRPLSLSPSLSSSSSTGSLTCARAASSLPPPLLLSLPLSRSAGSRASRSSVQSGAWDRSSFGPLDSIAAVGCTRGRILACCNTAVALLRVLVAATRGETRGRTLACVQHCCN